MRAKLKLPHQLLRMHGIPVGLYPVSKLQMPSKDEKHMGCPVPVGFVYFVSVKQNIINVMGVHLKWFTFHSWK
jgi:hypothetical protein